MLSSVAIAVALAVKAVDATSYSMIKEYAGSTFFDDWNFYGNCAWHSTHLPGDELY